MSNRADFFQTQMLWATRSAPYGDLISIPPGRGELRPEDRKTRRDAFAKLVEDIAVKMVQDFREENRKNYCFLKRVNVITILIGIALLISSLVVGIIYNKPDFAAAVGGVAIADFVAIFLVNPTE